MYKFKDRVRIKSLGPYAPVPDYGLVVGQAGTVFYVSGLYSYVMLDGHSTPYAFRREELEPLETLDLPGLDSE